MFTMFFLAFSIRVRNILKLSSLLCWSRYESNDVMSVYQVVSHVLICQHDFKVCIMLYKVHFEVNWNTCLLAQTVLVQMQFPFSNWHDLQ